MAYSKILSFDRIVHQQMRNGSTVIYRKGFYFENIIGSNTKSSYLPVYTLSERMFFNEDNKKGIYHYHKLKPNKYEWYSGLSNYDELIAMFNTSLHRRIGRQYSFASADDKSPKVLLIHHGLIMSEDHKILMIATVKNYDKIPKNEDVDIFVANELSSELTYKNVYKKLESSLIQPHKEAGFNIHYMDSKKIDELVYNALPPIKMERITDLQNVQETLNQQANNTIDQNYCEGIDKKLESPIKYGYTWKNIDLIVSSHSDFEAREAIRDRFLHTLFVTNNFTIDSFPDEKRFDSLDEVFDYFDKQLLVGDNTYFSIIGETDHYESYSFRYYAADKRIYIATAEYVDFIFDIHCRYYDNYERLMEKFGHSVLENITFEKDQSDFYQEDEEETEDSIPF